MALTKRRYSKEELARLGDAIYDTDVRPNLKAEDDGKFVAIDVDNGAFEIDADELTACDKLRARAPRAQIWLMRIGSRYVHRLGSCDSLGTR
jgi:hypothetical protein